MVASGAAQREQNWTRKSPLERRRGRQGVEVIDAGPPHLFSFISPPRQASMKGAGSYLIHPGAKGEKKKIHTRKNGKRPEARWKINEAKAKEETIFGQAEKT